MSIDSWISRHLGENRVAFDFEGSATTYEALASRIEITATALRAADVGVGDRVVYCGLNRVETFEILFACARIGAIMVPLNNRLVEAELSIQIADCDPTLVLATDGFAPTIRAAAAGRAVRDLDVDPFSADSTISAGPESAVAGVDSESIVLMVYTSGTTGKPKGAMLSQRALSATVINGVEHQDLSAADRILAPLPTFHVGGLNIQTLPALFVGAQVLLMRSFDVDGVLDRIEQQRATQGLLVPTMLAAVAASPRFAAADLSSLDGICTGSSVVPEALVATYLDRGVPIGQVYGATETGPTAVVLRYDEVADRPTSCGRAATNTEIRVVDQTGRDVDRGVSGEIWVRGSNLFTGYWNDPEATAAAFHDEWYRTGDVGYLDEQGYCYISDRLKDLIISGGENIYPAELEAVLGQHPAIAEIAVIGRPDTTWGEVPVAMVVPAAGEELTIESLRDWCAGRLARFKHPHELRLVETLPRTALGKVQKHLLRGGTLDG